MTADRLLRFYPRPWRERYGAEFLEMIGPAALGSQQVIDIAMGAVDAWLSADVRRSAARASLVSTSQGGRPMLGILKMACAGSKVRYTTKDMLISAGVLIGSTMLMLAVGIAINRSGHAVFGDALKALAFPVATVVSMPFGILKGQPWRAQTALLGVTLMMLVGASYVATLI